VIEEGGHKVLIAELQSPKVTTPLPDAIDRNKQQPGVPPDNADRRAADTAEEKLLRALRDRPAEQQVEAVKDLLRLRNPGFNGTIKEHIEHGVVTEIQFDGMAVHDLSPLLVFAGLQTLDCSCADPWQSPLADLSPLACLPLLSLRYPYHTWLGAEQLRSIKTLETINRQPAAAFWKNVDGEAAQFEIFRRLVAGLNPDAQVKAVADRLKKRNPGFDGNLRPVIDKGAVVELTFLTDAVVDISPLRALPELQRLHLNADPTTCKGKLADLMPLRGMTLMLLDLQGCGQVRDLTPLQGMKLTNLSLTGQFQDLTLLQSMQLTSLSLWACRQVRDLTLLQGMKLTNLSLRFCEQIRDLTPLQGIRLTSLSLWAYDHVRDLTFLQGMKLTDLDLVNCGQLRDLRALKGMPLTHLWLWGCGQVRDLTPLIGMSLVKLGLRGTGVSDLSPLKGMPVTFLDCSFTRVEDLSPLQGMPLTLLWLWGCGQVQDLTPLRNMPLEEFAVIPQNITKGMEGIRQMKSLKRISVNPGQLFPPEEFWKKYDAGEFKAATNTMPPPASPSGQRGASHNEITNSIGMKLVLIPAGKFQMGSPDRDKDASDVEKPQHEVEITKPFYLGKYEVTRGQFRQFVEESGYKTDAEKDGSGGYGYVAATKWFKGPNYNSEKKTFEGPGTKYFWRDPGFEQTDDHPVVNVSWNDAKAFCDWLSKKEGKQYRLPTEAEWEYSCRATTTTRYSSGDDPETLAKVGNVADGTAKKECPNWPPTITGEDGYVLTAPVGQFQPNKFGLYDMHGNVWEWCEDWFDEKYYGNSPGQDPTGPDAGSFRVRRGGAFFSVPLNCRAACRLWEVPAMRFCDIGFRVVLVR
jgi:formylglycine-generating enzyme required for sulfatase activity